jgi:hypothetical protein
MMNEGEASCLEIFPASYNVWKKKILFKIGGSHSGDYEELCFVGSNTMWSIGFQRIIGRYIPDHTTIEKY